MQSQSAAMQKPSVNRLEKYLSPYIVNCDSFSDMFNYIIENNPGKDFPSSGFLDGFNLPDDPRVKIAPMFNVKRAIKDHVVKEIVLENRLSSSCGEYEALCSKMNVINYTEDDDIIKESASELFQEAKNIFNLNDNYIVRFKEDGRTPVFGKFGSLFFYFQPGGKGSAALQCCFIDAESPQLFQVKLSFLIDRYPDFKFEELFPIDSSLNYACQTNVNAWIPKDKTSEYIPQIRQLFVDAMLSKINLEEFQARYNNISEIESCDIIERPLEAPCAQRAILDKQKGALPNL